MAWTREGIFCDHLSRIELKGRGYKGGNDPVLDSTIQSSIEIRQHQTQSTSNPTVSNLRSSKNVMEKEMIR